MHCKILDLLLHLPIDCAMLFSVTRAVLGVSRTTDVVIIHAKVSKRAEACCTSAEYITVHFTCKQPPEPP